MESKPEEPTRQDKEPCKSQAGCHSSIHHEQHAGENWVDSDLIDLHKYLALTKKAKDDAISMIAHLNELQHQLDEAMLAKQEMTTAAKENAMKMHKMASQLNAECEHCVLAIKDKEDAVKEKILLSAHLNKLQQQLDEAMLAKQEMTSAVKENEMKLRSKLTRTLAELDDEKQMNLGLVEKVTALQANLGFLLKQKELEDLKEEFENLKLQLDAQKLQTSTRGVGQVTQSADGASNFNKKSRKKK